VVLPAMKTNCWKNHISVVEDGLVFSRSQSRPDRPQLFIAGFVVEILMADFVVATCFLR